ncbi:response regulator transcription factor [Sediminibacterium sp. TEGAF015]|uniref:response regulator transcription factor n=1 Tax=Sediminibacterium sp. TEGAF015 TaxID=575378 RepID=UPI00220A6F2A|nr:response regulator transcription factor [Sediminibacterium sp. TEGAF015]BDQ12403.1 DNA-binding response regulator [Sediminibacterium sp. TEGAF015]
MKTTVALVDDHELLRSGLVGIINSLGDFEVIFEAGNGLEFIKKVNKNNPPDIVLLDITMPEMDGYETAAWIRKTLPSVKILVLSMLSNDMAIIRMLRNGVKGYIIKDSKPHVFKEAMESIQKNEFYVNELVRDKLINYVSNEEEDGKQTQSLLNISEQEAHFLELLCADKSYKEIADEMCVSVRTIDNYRDNLFKKLEIKTRVGLVLFAIKQGIANIHE